MLCSTFPFCSRKQGSAAPLSLGCLLAHRAFLGRRLELIVPFSSRLGQCGLGIPVTSLRWGQELSSWQCPWHLITSTACFRFHGTVSWGYWGAWLQPKLAPGRTGRSHSLCSFPGITHPVLCFGLYLFTGLAASWPVHSQGLMQGGVCICTVISFHLSRDMWLGIRSCIFLSWFLATAFIGNTYQKV